MQHKDLLILLSTAVVHWWGLNPGFNFLRFSKDFCCVMKRSNANPRCEPASYHHVGCAFRSHLSQKRMVRSGMVLVMLLTWDVM